MKKSFLPFLTIALALSVFSCKPKESAFKAAYEQAQETPKTEAPAPVAPVNKPTTDTHRGGAIQKEKIEAVHTQDVKKLYLYNVVVGSFMNKTNASALQEFLVAEGFNAFLAKNEAGMYRVIASSFADRNSAETSRDAIKRSYPSRFDDAWLLINE